MLIRPLQSGDSIAALTQLLHAAYARLGEMGFNYTAVDQSEHVTLRRIADGDCIVAVDDTTIVGTILFRSPGTSKGCPWYERPEVATIGQFGVLPDSQGRGVGNLLLTEAERRARRTGATELALDTSEGAHHLIAWYERRGFRFVEHANWRGKMYRSVIMSKALNSAV
ncbi:GNAT family N-acetyltransferase [Methylobacterium sp. JK268]